MKDVILIRGARVNNLQNITVEIPKNKLVVITGLSGSGKSSLAFDTIFAEGQRRYVESLSSYARQFLELQDKPDVDEIKGLAPTIAIDQRGISENPRSTVGTITEIADYLRLLFARAGRPLCLTCHTSLSRASTEEIVRWLQQDMAKYPVRLYAPLITRNQTTNYDLLERLTRSGFTEVRLNGQRVPLTTLQETGLPDQPFKLDVLIGTAGPQELEEGREQVRLQILTALDLGDGSLYAEANDKTLFLSTDLTCPQCGVSVPKLEPRNFSFNSPHGACEQCTGLGIKATVIPELVIPNPRLTLAQGAIKPWTKIGTNQSSRLELLQAVADGHGFNLDTPVGELTKKAREIVLYGNSEKTYAVKGTVLKFIGVIPELETRYRETDSDYIRKEIEAFMQQVLCPACQGARLKPGALAVTFTGKNIAQICALSVAEALKFLTQTHDLNNSETTIATPIIKELLVRLKNLEQAGIGYLTLDRSSTTLSGGEAQRVRLAVQLGTVLTGVIYVLDEPTVGLHERDTTMLLKLLQTIQAAGNSVIVVEHDREMMQAAEYLIDLGPGAGRQGGKIVAAGTPAAVAKNKHSLTGLYLAHKKRITTPVKLRKGNGKALTIRGATAFNLKNIDVKIPLGKLVCVTGVSGSGKSTLILEILGKALAHKLYGAHDLPAPHQDITGLHLIDKVITVDQSPIGRTPRSNPATYTGIFTTIRDLYTEIPEAKLKGFDAGTFSFNVKGGRCEACAGEGYLRIPMQFMPETYVQCNECHGRRYRPEALEIYYKNKNIADVLTLSASEAKDFFKDVPLLHEKLQVLEDVGLGYIRLGQPAPTLSGGEAQRVKLATELSRRATGKTLYILDEPTTGLHFEDIAHLLTVLQRLVDKGNSVVIIEHNLDVIKCADFVIDMGPEGGDKGGYVIASGMPRDIGKVKKSYTGQYLKRVLKVV